MASNPGFVPVSGHLEPSAIAGDIVRDAYNRLGELIVCTCQWLEDDGNGLNEVQRASLTANASRFFDGFEQNVIDEIVTAIGFAKEPVAVAS